VTLRLERLDPNHRDWQLMDGFADRVVFQTEAWLSFLERTQRATLVLAAVKDGSSIVGFFTGLVIRRFGVPILGSPFAGWTTSYLGFNLVDPRRRREAWEALPRFAFGELGCLHLECRDRYTTEQDLQGLGFASRPFTLFEIDLGLTEEQLLAAMTGPCRTAIRKAAKAGVVIEEATELGFADDYHAQLVDVFAKQQLDPSYDVERVRELIRLVGPTGNLLLLRARDPQGRSIATGIFPALNRTMYFWGGASWRQHQSLRPNEALFWYAMRYWKARGVTTFDMGGGGEYKRKFGPTESNVPSFTKSRFAAIAALRDPAQRVVVARQRAMARLRRRPTAPPAEGTMIG
jgi:hypothetical protein